MPPLHVPAIVDLATARQEDQDLAGGVLGGLVLGPDQVCPELLALEPDKLRL